MGASALQGDKHVIEDITLRLMPPVPPPSPEEPPKAHENRVWHGFWASESDRAMLTGICRHYGDAAYSAVLRRLIRDEARRLGIT